MKYGSCLSQVCVHTTKHRCLLESSNEPNQSHQMMSNHVSAKTSLMLDGFLSYLEPGL